MKTSSAIVVIIIGLGILKSYGQWQSGQYNQGSLDRRSGVTVASPLNGSSAAAGQQQMAIYAAQQEQQEYEAEIAAAQQQELALIYSKDPWRNINGTTNLARGNGWLEFQGQLQETLSDGIVFKGKIGQVLTIHTDPDYSDHLVKIVNTDLKKKYGKSMETTYQSVSDTHIERGIVYGDDLFFVEKFPYPGDRGQGYQQMMAFDGDYYSYTNSAGNTITIRRLIYGTPCAKIWSAEEIAAANQKVEARKVALVDAALKFNQAAADRGDAYGLLRMGERYRDGEGVEKDLAKARDYFSKAAAAGSQTATEELSELSKN